MAGETPKLWSKLEAAGDVTSPQLGTGGAEVGSPTYEAAKFNNGILSNIDNEGCYFPCNANSIHYAKGTIEFWAKLNFDSTEGAQHILCSFRGPDTYYGIRFRYEATGGFEIKIYKHLTSQATAEVTGLSWSAGDLLHFGLVWDKDGVGIGGGKTLALYIDNVLKGSDTATWTADSEDAANNLYLGSKPTGADHSDAVIDNLKTYDICKIDFSDRNVEGGNIPPTAPTALEVDGKSTPTGANCVTSTPQFTAIFNDPDAGDISNAIEIQVGSAEGLSDMWDSGWLGDTTTEGNRGSVKTYDGAALSAGTSYWWRCRFRDDDDEEGAWSDWQQFDVCAAPPPVVAVAVGGLLSQIW